MKLDAFYAAIGPFLLGDIDHAAGVRALYGCDGGRDGDCNGDGQGGVDAERLRIYGAFCRTHRHEALSVYGHCEAAMIHHLGRAAWDDLVDRYFRAHPMRNWELNANGMHLPEFLAKHGVDRLPFLAELADFEWWEWQTQVAPDAPEEKDPDRGPLRLGDTVELRQYSHDFLDWLDERDAKTDMASAGLPERGEHLVLFWRDRDDDLRREPASPEELLVLRLVSEGGKIPEDLRETVDDLFAAGILLGEV